MYLVNDLVDDDDDVPGHPSTIFSPNKQDEVGLHRNCLLLCDPQKGWNW